MSTVIVFGPTGQVGSVAAKQAADRGAKVWLAMRDVTKDIPGLTKEQEQAQGFERVQADLQKPETVSQAVKASGAKRAFLYLVHGASDHLRGAIEALKSGGIELVVFLSSFTILLNKPFREVDQSDVLAFVHGQIEANLDDVFGSDHYVALRPGCFITNLLSEKQGITAGEVKLYGGSFEQDNMVPSDIGKVAGVILASGPQNGQKIVYLYGPKISTIHESIARIGKALGKDLDISPIDGNQAYKNYTSAGMPDAYATFMVKVLSNPGPDKGKGERFPYYEEGVNNVKLYTGQPSTTLEEWVQNNKQIFAS